MILLRDEFNRPFNNLFLVQDRNVLSVLKQQPASGDLVLSFDFSVIIEMREKRISTGLLDRIVDPTEMDKYNYPVYDFFEKWHLDENGQDHFCHKGIDFGKTFRQEIWNDITYTSRIAICIKAASYISRKNTICFLTETLASDFCIRFGFDNKKYDLPSTEKTVYSFPVFRWMDEQIRPSSLITHIGVLKGKMTSILLRTLEFFRGYDKNIPGVYIQVYHPTLPLARYAVSKNDFKLYTDGPLKGARKFDIHQRLPQPIISLKQKKTGINLLNKFKHEKHPTLMVDEYDIAPIILSVIEKQLVPRIGVYIATIETLLKYFVKRRLDLIILIANLGITANILLSIAKKRGVKSFLIINGFLSKDFSIEGRDSDWINSYGPCIKEHYFKNASNIVCLGDPRMDSYINALDKKESKLKDIKHISIGAGGYSPLDLNSCLAAEFLFLDTVLKSCDNVRGKGFEFDITLKVRVNGYKNLYDDFVFEYYPDLTINIVDDVPMQEVLSKSDLYVSIYSQTHFEAALLDIPSVYLKTDDETIDPPYNGKSELYTVFDEVGMTNALESFLQGKNIGLEFRKLEVLEKYWGKLDGKCTERNYDFIQKLIDES